MSQDVAGIEVCPNDVAGLDVEAEGLVWGVCWSNGARVLVTLLVGFAGYDGAYALAGCCGCTCGTKI